MFIITFTIFHSLNICVFRRVWFGRRTRLIITICIREYFGIFFFMFVRISPVGNYVRVISEWLGMTLSNIHRLLLLNRWILLMLVESRVRDGPACLDIDITLQLRLLHRRTQVYASRNATACLTPHAIKNRATHSMRIPFARRLRIIRNVLCDAVHMELDTGGLAARTPKLLGRSRKGWSSQTKRAKWMTVDRPIYMRNDATQGSSGHCALHAQPDWADP